MSRLSHLLTADPAKVQPWHAEHERKYNDRERFRMHKLNAKNRGIPFLFTFEEWLGWWKATGHYEERGSRRGQYVMARKGDQGPYAPGNVECMIAADNSTAPHLGKNRSKAAIEKFRNTMARKRKEASQ
jgi:hypothetical protein